MTVDREPFSNNPEKTGFRHAQRVVRKRGQKSLCSVRRIIQFCLRKHSKHILIMEISNKIHKSHSTLIKGCIVFAIALVLQIPVIMVRGLVNDRKLLSEEVRNELSVSWGQSLDIYAPKLLVTYTRPSGGDKAEREVLSSEVTVNAVVDTELLHRSIYDVPVYRADLSICGKVEFEAQDLYSWTGDVFMSFPLNTSKGLEGRPVLVIKGKEYPFEVEGKRLVAAVPYDSMMAMEPIDYEIKVKSKGMDKVRFLPSGADFRVSMKSDCTSPSFAGVYLPTDRRVTETGFEAEWSVTNLNTLSSAPSDFGVELMVPAGQYQQTERAIKYSFLIILLVFVAIYLVEVVTRSRINIVQYVVTGLSLCLFYLLLLSVSEYVSFAWSYVIAAVMTTGALGGYFYGFLKSKVALAFTAAVAFLYGFIYVLLQMETGSLLMGTMALFILLAVVMYFTRNDRFMNLYRGPVVE